MYAKRQIQFNAVKCDEIRNCFLQIAIFLFQWVVDAFLVRSVTSHNCQVFLFYFSCGKSLLHRSMDFFIECKEQYATRFSIKPVNGIYMHVKLISKHL